MPPSIALFACFAFSYWMIKKDFQRRPGVSRALWIPMLWVAILGSRPVSMWLAGVVSSEGSLNDGSPVDRFFYLSLILPGLYVLSKRQVRWGSVVAANKTVFLFYAYWLVSVLWADSMFPSFKRLFKDFGCVVMALIILTEEEPDEAFKAVFVRCAYLLIPLSECFLRYIPDLGRVYSKGGAMEATGVTCQKNSLGALIVVCGLPLLLDFLESLFGKKERRSRMDLWGTFLVLFTGVWLLHTCNSKTSMLCFATGAFVLASPYIPVLKNHTRELGIYAPVTAFGLFILDSMFGLKEAFLEKLDRDMTFTGRTQVWDFLLAQKTDPVFGVGYYSLWSNPKFRAIMPDWMSNSAHSGYLEIYIDGGCMGLFFLGLMLIAMWWRVNVRLQSGAANGPMRLAFIMSTLIANVSESYFARLSLIWFGFLLVALEYRHPYAAAVARDQPVENYVPQEVYLASSEP